MAIEKVTGIVTDVVKHSDRHNVVTLFARGQGRVSLLSSAGGGKTARMRNSALMPLSVIEADINFNPTRELQFLGAFSRAVLWKDLYFNPVKSAVGMFLAEFINAYIRQSPPDARLWDFIYGAVGTLDAMCLDMRGGVMTQLPPAHRDRIVPADARMLPLLARMNVRTSPLFRMTGAQRRELLGGLLHYCAVHFPGLGNLKSPSVLAEVFG